MYGPSYQRAALRHDFILTSLIASRYGQSIDGKCWQEQEQL